MIERSEDHQLDVERSETSKIKKYSNIKNSIFYKISIILIFIKYKIFYLL